MYPTITFQVDLGVPKTEALGANTNQSDKDMLHPDRHVGNQDGVPAAIANHASEKITWLSGLLGGSNANLRDGDTFTLSGGKAEYARKLFVAAPGDGIATAMTGEATGDRAVLVITSVV
jgi:hypothetical protein